MQITFEQVIFTAIFVFIIGTVIGSFLNVVILRAFSGESIVLPPSKCPKCGNKLKWQHNIPILSYIFLRGKCGFCKEHISFQYPVVEFITGVIFLLTFLKFGFHIETLFGFLIASLLIIISATDIKEKVVFDIHTYILIGTGIVYNLYRTIAQIIHANQSSLFFTFSWDWLLHSPITMSIAGGLAGVLIMFIFAKIVQFLAGKIAVGEGDTYILAGLGTVFCLQNILFILVLAIIIEVVMFFPVFIKNLICQKDWACIISLLLLVIFGCIYYPVTYTIYYYNEILSYILFGLIIITLIAFCYFVRKGIQSENKACATYLPFGPFLAITGLIVLLLPNTMNAIINLITGFFI